MPATSRKLVLQIAARGGAGADLAARLHDLAESLRARLGAGGRSALFLRVPADPFAPLSSGMRGFDATLELRSGGPDPGPCLVAAVEGAGERLAPVAHLDLSAALVGIDHDIVPCAAAPLRYQYAMRRRAGLTHAEYLAHYRHVHAEFGRRLPGILGYTQFHVEPALARAAARGAGLGLWAIDSISELHLQTVEAFMDALARMGERERNAASRDEEHFVDRANSVMFTTARDTR